MRTDVHYRDHSERYTVNSRLESRANDIPETAADSSATVQILATETETRRELTDLLPDRYDLDTASTVGNADLYLVAGESLSAHREALRARVEREDPVFCPVVIVRGDDAGQQVSLSHPAEARDPQLVDAVVDTPVDRAGLLRRLESLLVRRRQSVELRAQVRELEDRERELRRFKRAVEQSGQAVFIADIDGRVEFVNAAFEEMTGYTEAAVVGESPTLVRADESTDRLYEQLDETVSAGRSWHHEVVNERPDGHQYVVEETVTTIANGRGSVEGVVSVMTDVTERLQREQALRDRETELDLLRQVLTRVLRHNIRNALTVIHGQAEALVGDTPDEIADRARTIVETAERLEATSETARRYSALVDGDRQIESHDLAEIVETAVADVRERYPDVSVETAVPDGCRVRTSDGTERAVGHIVENAVEHNNADEPWVRIQADAREGDDVRLVIEDNGPGIPGEELAALRNLGETQLTHSTGVDLWLSKWVIEQAGGDLSLRNTETGARAVVELPSPETVDRGGVEIPDLKRRERKLQTTLDRMTDAFVAVDGDWQVTEVDSRAESILGVERSHSRGRPLRTVFADTLGRYRPETYRRVMATREPASFEEHYPEIDEWLEVQVYPDLDGGISVYFREISERKERESQLRETNERLEQILKTVPAGVVQVDAGGEIAFANERAQEMLGTDDDLVGRQFDDDWQMTDLDGVPTPRAEWPCRRVFDARETVRDVRQRIEGPDGVERVLSVNGAPIFGPEGEVESVVLAGTDITARTRRQQELERYATIVETLDDAVYVLDETGRFEYVNDSFVDLVGYDRETILGSPPSLIKDEETVEQAKRQLGRLLSSSGPDTVAFDMAVQPREGDPIPCEDRMGVLPYEGESFEGSVGALRDVRDRRERKARLRRFERAIEAAGFPVYMTDPDGTITYANPAFERTTGYSAAEAIGATPALLDSGTHDEAYFRDLWETITDGDVWEEEIRNRAADGQEYVAHQTIAPVTNLNGEIVQFVAIQAAVTGAGGHRDADEYDEETATSAGSD